MSKKYLVVDTEFHHVPWEAAQKAGKTSEGELDFKKRVETPNPTYQKVYDIEASLRHMEECGVDMTLLGLAPWSERGVEVCKAINDGLAKVVKEYPGKFIPLAHIPCYSDVEGSIDELDRAVNDLGLKGATVVTSQHDMRLDDEYLRPFFKKANELGIPIVVHPSVKIPVWGGTKYGMSGSVSREYDIIKALVEVLCGVLPEFPDLTFLFSHFGGGVPFLLGRIMSWYSPEDGTIPKEKIGLPKTISEFEDFGLKDGFDKLFDRLYINMAGTGGWMPAVKQALLSIKPDRICFGSDYPFEMGRPDDLKTYIEGIKGLDIPEQDIAKMLGENVKNLFKA